MLDYLKNKNELITPYITAKDCFNALNPEQQGIIKNNTTILEFKKGETIIKQGFVASHVLYLESGLAKLDVTNDHKTSTVKLLYDGAFIGIICSFACKSIDFSAKALENTIVHMIDMTIFQELIRQNGEFSLKLVQHMSSLTNNMIHWITRISDKNIDGALAILLLEFSDIYKNSKFKLPVTRIGLAEMAGYSKESVIHTLSRFNKDGIVNVSDKQIEIMERDRLEVIARNG
ncbi:MAG: Crp/Fnr family transcriptional regulator [Bacteroidales bacterium]|nr:Crp/Fnr family transcriptional regulator [Bacteroidales bacterium]